MKNFIIVGVQRTGSSALAESIGLHPQVASGWEWTQKVSWVKKISAAERGLAGDFTLLPSNEQKHMASVFQTDMEWLGFRRLFRASDKWIGHPCMAPALWVDRLEDHILWLRGRRDIHIIHLVRRQTLDWLKSVYVAKATNYYVNQKYPADLRIKVPELKAIARVKTKNWVDYRLSKLCSSNSYLRIYYEDLSNDREGVCAEALRFLGFSPDNIELANPQLQKQSNGGPSDYIVNYSRLYRALNRLNLLLSTLDNSS